MTNPKQVQFNMFSRVRQEDSKQIKLLNEVMRLRSKISQVKWTILLYDLYVDRQRNKVELDNLNTIAQVLLKKDLKVDIKEKKKGKNIIVMEQVSEKEFQASKIDKQVFQVQEKTEKDQEISDNIVIYTSADSSLRVVVLPIQKEAINIEEIKKKSHTLKEKEAQKNDQLKKLSGETRKEVSREWQAEKKKQFDEGCKLAEPKHQKALRIKAIEQQILTKTELVSVCCLTELSDRRHNTLKDFQEEFSNLFKTPKGFKPQFIMHQFDPDTQEKEQLEAVNHEDVTTVFSLVDGNFGIHKFNSYEEKYYFKPNEVRTKFYENLEKSEDECILYTISHYTENWNKICVDTATVLVNIILRASQLMKKDAPTSTEDLSSISNNNNSMSPENSLKDIQSYSTFNDIFEKYISESLYLPGQVSFSNSYKENFSKISPQKGYSFLSESIEPLAFTHVFYKIGNEILKNVGRVEMESNSNKIEILKEWKTGLAKIFELISSENGAFLQRQDNEEFRCPDMKRFFNFLNFAIDSIEWIKKITGKDVGFVDDLKSKLEKLNMKGSKLLSFILKNYEKLFAKMEPVHFYDILLQIIKDNSSAQIEKDLQFIHLLIHCRKADLISKNYSFNHEKVIEAIRSYAIILEETPNLNENKRSLINVEEIMSKIAKLFKIVGLYAEAAEIYTKMREHHHADKCYRMILPQLSRKKKVQKLLEWGQIFEDDSEYDLALSYFREAYSIAKDVENKKKATKCKVECLKKFREETNKEELLLQNNFLEDGNLEAYTSKRDIRPLLLKAKNRIFWDSHNSRSIIQADDPTDISSQ